MLKRWEIVAVHNWLRGTMCKGKNVVPDPNLYMIFPFPRLESLRTAHIWLIRLCGRVNKIALLGVSVISSQSSFGVNVVMRNPSYTCKCSAMLVQDSSLVKCARHCCSFDPHTYNCVKS